MDTTRAVLLVLAFLGAVAGILVVGSVVVRLSRRSPGRALESSLAYQELLLEEGVVTQPVAPGLAGRAELRKAGAAIEVAIKAADASQAFARGMRVRVIDYDESCFLVEPAEEEHLVR